MMESPWSPAIWLAGTDETHQWHQQHRTDCGAFCTTMIESLSVPVEHVLTPLTSADPTKV